MPDADAEESGIRPAGQEALGGGQGFGVYLVIAGVDVQNEELVPVGLFHLWACLLVI